MLASANLLIGRYGEQASLHAAARHVELWDMGAFEGARVWNRIYNAILDMQHPELIEAPAEEELH